MLDTKFAFWNEFSEVDFPTKKQNRDRKIDKRARAKQDFMKLNSAGLKKVILPILERKAKGE